MDKIRKFIQRLNKKSALKIKKAMIDITTLNLDSYEVKKLKGHKNLYRIRIGEMRIVFRKTESEGIPVDINFRGNIYKK